MKNTVTPVTVQQHSLPLKIQVLSVIVFTCLSVCAHMIVLDYYLASFDVDSCQFTAYPCTGDAAADAVSCLNIPLVKQLLSQN